MRKNSQDKYQKRRLLSTYFSVVVSISLVLFLVGLLGLLLLNSKKVADHFKEQIAFTIYINDTAKPIEIKQLQKS
ncbi:MAG: cell division transport system permease protein, partial [Candidatus Arcticimaribacter sp.]